MAERLELSDQEIGFISMALGKVDPTGMIAEAVGIQAKIRAYAMAKQSEQVAVAADVDTAEE